MKCQLNKLILVIGCNMKCMYYLELVVFGGYYILGLGIYGVYKKYVILVMGKFFCSC